MKNNGFVPFMLIACTFNRERGVVLKKQTFIQGAMILLAAGIINRILGFIPRIALPRVIGAEGVGIYQLSYPFFIVLVTLITGGIPLAVAKLVAEADTGANRYSPQRILQVSLSFTLTLGVVFMFLCILFAPWVTKYVLTDERVYHTFVSMSPMIAIIAVSAVYRGYFQGKQNMMPTAISSIVETIIRIVCVIWFAWLLLPHGIAQAAAGAMLGALVGEFGGMLVLLWKYNRQKKELPLAKQQNMSNLTTKPSAKPLNPIPSVLKETGTPQPGLIRRLLAISIPVTAGRLVGSLSYLAETIVTAQSLALAGISKRARYSTIWCITRYDYSSAVAAGGTNLIARDITCAFTVRSFCSGRSRTDSQKNASGITLGTCNRCSVFRVYVCACRTDVSCSV